MTDRPIIFSAPMVRALLDGTKTQTRRVLKPWPGKQAGWLSMETLHRAPTCFLAEVEGNLGVQMQHPHAGTTQSYGKVDRMSPLTWVRLPYAPSDRLWVREAAWICPPNWTDTPGNPMGPHSQEVAYSADDTRGGTAEAARDYGIRLRPSIHMPRWASRLTLTVSDVRVQRVQDISEDDAEAEGLRRTHAGGPWGEEGLIEDFYDLWNSLHGPDAWDANPWVVCLSFEVHRKNIDSMGAAA